MLDLIISFDREVLLAVNGLHSPALDCFMAWVSATRSWIPLYAVLVAVIIYRERPYRFIFTVIFAALTVTLCDQLSGVIKEAVARLRPSHTPGLTDLIHLVDGYKGGTYGFVSAHAANTFGTASYLAGTFRTRGWRWCLFGWATLVSLSRVYLGVHYPLDIVCGALLGILVAQLCLILKKKLRLNCDSYD
jgi:undecaprenyl-diphosphatase